MFFFQAEDGIRDLVRSRGLGDVYKRQVYRDGKAYPGKWVRADRQAPLTFLDANGQVIPLWLSLIHI